MEALAYGVSVFIGLVSGVIVSVFTEIIKERNRNKKEIKNLRFEIECNRKKVDHWLELADDLKVKISEDRISEFYGYFNFSLTMYSTALRMFQSGLIYSCLPYEEIEKLQEIGNYLTVNGENMINSKINYYKNSYQAIDKKEMARFTDMWISELKKCKANMNSILKAIK